MKMYYIYKSMGGLNSAIATTKHPIFIFIDRFGKIYACIKYDLLCKLMLVEYYLLCVGLHYFVFHNKNMVIERLLKSDDIEHYGILLPLLVFGKEPNTGYIDSNK